MPAKLSTTINKISSVPNPTNSAIIQEFSEYMIRNGSSEHQNNNLKAVIAFANFLGSHTTFCDIQKKEQIAAFLDTKINREDNENKWITTWNNYLTRLKLFFRWLYNARGRGSEDVAPQSDWETPVFARIKEKKTKRVSPYSETELWERDEILFILKYEPYKRNKAALALFWDLDARNHEIILLKIKHIRLRERYGEGEIPYQAKTGSGPVLLTASSPPCRMRFWINLGCDPIAANTTKKDDKDVRDKVLENWAQFQDVEHSTEDFEKKLESGIYDKGMAILCCKFRLGPHKGKYIDVIDFDRGLRSFADAVATLHS